MADVSIVYKGTVVAELDGTGTKTLQTAATYCEGDILVAYTPQADAIPGNIDAENNITIADLPDGRYVVQYRASDGTVSVIGRLVVGGKLPSEYQQVEWVQINTVIAESVHSGIKTDLRWSGVNKIVTKVQNVEGTNLTDMFFSTWSNTDTKAAPFIATSNANMLQNGSGLSGYTASPNNVPTTNTDANTFTMTWTGNTADGIIFIGSWHDSAYSNPHKWYSIEMYKNDVLVGEFIPCYRITDGVIGFYDAVSGVFYTNANDEFPFLKGADV